MSSRKIPDESMTATREWLRQFPAIRDGKPLKVGVVEELIERAPATIPAAAIRLALMAIAQETPYLEAVVAGGYRCDLDGNPLETEQQRITEHQIGYSEGRLAERRAWERRREKAIARRKQREAAELRSPGPAETPAPETRDVVSDVTGTGTVVKRVTVERRATLKLPR